jgi:hypothetical protein
MRGFTDGFRAPKGGRWRIEMPRLDDLLPPAPDVARAGKFLLGAIGLGLVLWLAGLLPAGLTAPLFLPFVFGTTQLATLQDAIPVVTSTADRNARFPSPMPNQRVENLETGNIERFGSAGWATDFAGQSLAGAFVVKAAPFGAKGDGVTDDTAAVRLAEAALEAAGGGTLLYPPGTYIFSTVGLFQIRVPVANATFQPEDQNHQYHVLLQNVSNVKWLGYGAKLKSTTTNSGEMFMLDGVRNFEIEGIEIESPTAKDGAGAVTVAGMNGFGITSQTRDAYNFRFTNVTATNIYTAIYCFGDPASAFRVRGVTISNLRHNQGIYSLACHDNGDDVFVRGLQSINALREFFIYGVDGHDGEVYSEGGFGGFGAIIKAYDRDCTNIKYKLRTKKNISAANVDLASQHAPAVQATPKRLINVEVEVNNQGTTAPAAVSFSYYRDNTPTATSANNLFTGITLAGIHEQQPIVNVTQNDAAAARGTLNTDRLVLLNGALYSIYNRTGFLDYKQTYNTFVPVLRINNLTAGITYSASTKGEFWRDGQFIEVLVRIVLTSKGANAGPVELDLPVPSSNYNQSGCNPVVNGWGAANMAGLTGVLTGFVSQAGTKLTIQQQGAAATVNLADTNLTNTSNFQLQFRYPL